MAVPALNPGAYPVAVNQQSYSGAFIPILWQSTFIVKYYLTTVFGSIARTQYQNAISKFGDTVRIPLVPDIVVHNYVEGQDLVPQHPGVDVIDMLINRGKYFNTVITDITKKQSLPDYMSKWGEDSAQKMSIAIDRDIINEIPADAHPTNAGATAGKITGNLNLGVAGTPLPIWHTDGTGTNNIIDVIYRATQCLNENDVPGQPSERYLVGPAWFIRMLLRSEIKNADLTGDATSPLRNGLVGQIDTIGKIYSSNNILPVADGGGETAYHVLVGHMDALSYATQLTNLETLRAQNTFGDLMRGLQVFGFKVIKPEALVDLYVYEEQPA